MDRVPPTHEREVVALTGGIGGAKLALGLKRVLAPQSLTLVANTGDDFEHLGLSICPDLDTVLYTLADLADPEKGWGRRDETWNFMKALGALGGPDWFQLGDADLAIHVERTHRLRAGESLTGIMADLGRRLDIGVRLLPMSDDPVRTRVLSAAGWLDFQDYFVRQRCDPVVMQLQFDGVAQARANPAMLEKLADPHLRAVVICPSNPLISIEPILALTGVRRALADTAAPVIAVSPLVGGEAIKGPTAKMMREMGSAATAAAVADRYNGLLDGYVIDDRDAGDSAGIKVPWVVTNTVMKTLQERDSLARVVLEFADQLREMKKSNLKRNADE